MAFRKEMVVRASLVAAGAAGLWVAQSQQQRVPLTMEKVSANLWVVVGNGGNVAVMPTSDGVVVVDDKFAADAPDIIAKVKTVTEQPIKFVLNTHQHGDHTGGNEALRAAGAELIIHKQARANMVKAEQPGIPRMAFSDEQQLVLGGREVIAKYVGRGHTNGDAVVLFPGERVLHTGDLFVASGAPFCDTNNGGSIKDWEGTIQKALQLDFDTVIPGHGAIMKKADLVKWAQTLGTLRTRIKTACAGGVDDAGKRMDWSGLGMNGGPMFDRGLPGMCKELAQ
jgi:glyoxylase-like metal-dependent hydrolase (beta-lactamase superfamily II)